MSLEAICGRARKLQVLGEWGCVAIDGGRSLIRRSDRFGAAGAIKGQ